MCDGRSGDVLGAGAHRDVPLDAPRPKPPVTFADVARRTTSRTTDLIAIAVVLVAALTLGRQVLHWWNAEPPAASPASEAGSAPAWEAGRGPVSLEFGDLPLAITRQLVRGDRETAVDTLVARCWEAGQNAAIPSLEPTAGEQRLLERIADLEPVTAEPGVTEVYLLDERFPMAAAVGYRQAGAAPPVAEVVRLRPGPDGARPNSDEFSYKGANPDGAAKRLLCWGMAMPLGNSAWTLYVFRQSAARHAPADDVPDVPLPPGALRNLSVRDAQGGGLVGFSVNAPADTLMKFYDDWCSRHEWVATDGWQAGDRVWTARFRTAGDPGAALVDVRFAEDRGGLLLGLIQIVPSDPLRGSGAEQRGRE